MRSFCQLAVLALPLFSTAVAASPNKEADHPKTIYASAQEAFQDLLNALPEESLQAALSGLKDFKIGVFESHHRGVEHIHHDNPALATKLIVDAVNDLKKRQTSPGNGTTSATDPTPPESTPATDPTPPESTPATNPTPPESTPTTNPSPSEPTTDTTPPATVTNTQQQTTTQQVPTTIRQTTTEQRPALIPVENTVTEDGTVVVRTTSVLSEVTASVPVTLVRTNSVGSTVTATENRPAVIRTTTDSAGRTTVTTSAANYAPTSGEVQTVTDEAGSTFLTTFTPGGGLVSSIKLITTTDAQGRPSTMTSYTYVDPIQATGTGGGAGGDSTENPSVQTAAAAVNGVPYAAVGLGAMAFFF
jgi:hypothetical protein